MVDEKRKKKLEKKYPELGRDRAASEYRQMAMSQQDMPCPKCRQIMVYKAEGEFEGLFCSECDKGVDIGTVDELMQSPDTIAREKTIVEKAAVAESVNKFRKKRKNKSDGEKVDDSDGTDGDSA